MSTSRPGLCLLAAAIVGACNLNPKTEDPGAQGSDNGPSAEQASGGARGVADGGVGQHEPPDFTGIDPPPHPSGAGGAANAPDAAVTTPPEGGSSDGGPPDGGDAAPPDSGAAPADGAVAEAD